MNPVISQDVIFVPSLFKLDMVHHPYVVLLSCPTSLFYDLG